MKRHRAGSGMGILALGIAMALSSVSVASAGQYKAKSDQKAKYGKAKPKATESAGSNGARSASSAAVADIQTGKWTKLCALVIPSQRSTCNSTVKGHAHLFKAYLNVRLESVTVKGNQATAQTSCSGGLLLHKVCGFEECARSCHAKWEVVPRL
jgi:hypothetical protein